MERGIIITLQIVILVAHVFALVNIFRLISSMNSLSETIKKETELIDEQQEIHKKIYGFTYDDKVDNKTVD